MTERFDWTHDGMELDECGDYVRFADAQAEIARLRGALTTIIDLNVQYCEDRYGDKSYAESMACVRTAREALK